MSPSGETYCCCANSSSSSSSRGRCIPPQVTFLHPSLLPPPTTECHTSRASVFGPRLQASACPVTAMTAAGSSPDCAAASCVCIYGVVNIHLWGESFHVDMFALT
jgi:hypothetical protein